MSHPIRPLHDATAAALVAAGLDPADVERVVRAAFEEDLRDGVDLTSVATIDPADRSTADFVVRAPGVVAGVPVLAAVLEMGLPADSHIELRMRDGQSAVKGDVIATVSAQTISLLTVERTALNILCRLCGTATATRRWVDAVAGTAAHIRDTRKTTPGLRALEKYAVRCGGGVNHRIGLYDAVLVKDNHVLAAGGVGRAIDAVAGYLGGRTDVVVQVEVDTLDELDEALAHGVRQVLLDNMTTEQMTEAVRRVRAHDPEVKVEASGGLTVERASEVARTGVDFLAVGGLTHSAGILDVALDFRAD